MASFHGLAQRQTLKSSPLSPNYGQNLNMPIKTPPAASKGPAAPKPTTAPVKALNKTAARPGDVIRGMRGALGLAGKGVEKGLGWIGKMWKGRNAPLIQEAAKQPRSVLMGMAAERAKRDAARASKMKPPGQPPAGPVK